MNYRNLQMPQDHDYWMNGDGKRKPPDGSLPKRKLPRVVFSKLVAKKRGLN